MKSEAEQKTEQTEQETEQEKKKKLCRPWKGARIILRHSELLLMQNAMNAPAITNLKSVDVRVRTALSGN